MKVLFYFPFQVQNKRNEEIKQEKKVTDKTEMKKKMKNKKVQQTIRTVKICDGQLPPTVVNRLQKLDYVSDIIQS